MNEINIELERLFLLGLQGDREAYKSFLSQAVVYLRRHLNQQLPASSDEKVELLIGDILQMVHLKRHTFDVDKDFSAWLQAIAQYKIGRD